MTNPTIAASILHECLAIREKKEPGARTMFNAKSPPGAALLGQKKYTDAEPLLLAGYQGMKKRAKTPVANAPASPNAGKSAPR